MSYIKPMVIGTYLGNDGSGPEAPAISHARFGIGDIVRHRSLRLSRRDLRRRSVFANSEEWYQAIPEDIRPRKDQPFYHLLAENGREQLHAYVSQQNLLVDDSEEPVDHPEIAGMFDAFAEGRYRVRTGTAALAGLRQVFRRVSVDTLPPRL
jgi:heat shock protein HspQ